MPLKVCSLKDIGINLVLDLRPGYQKRMDFTFARKYED
jgi:hypothetical protein